MATATYTFCTLTAFLCALMLLQAYVRGRYRLLLWSGLCFAGLTASNLLLVLDKIVFPTAVDLQIWRSAITLAAMSVLLYGLIVEAE